LSKHFQLFDKNSIAVTVDDGDISFYNYMFPLLKQRNIPAILFIITELIDTNIPFWWDELVYLLGDAEGEKKVWEVKSWLNKDRVEYLEKLRELSDKPRLEQVQLTTEQLLEMQQAGVIIANHSHTHPMFDKCTAEELKQELQNSKAFFQKHGLNGYELLAYPNGNVNLLAEEIAKQEGIKYAFLFDHQLSDLSGNPYRISRLSVTDQISIGKMRFILSGFHSKLLPLRKKLYNMLKR
ncbi:polysaccharide deacetylase family protein, partial [Pontibacter rugosus]